MVEETLKTIGAKEILLLPKVENRLKANQKTWDNFNQLAPGYRKQYVAWIQSVKKPETLERRLKEVIEHLARNETPGMK